MNADAYTAYIYNELSERNIISKVDSRHFCLIRRKEYQIEHFDEGSLLQLYPLQCFQLKAGTDSSARIGVTNKPQRAVDSHSLCCRPWLQSLAAYCAMVSIFMCNAWLGSPHNAVLSSSIINPRYS